MFDTTEGESRVDLDTTNTPGTVNNFVNLARNSYYDGTEILAKLAHDLRARALPISRAAARLVALREAWLNPPEWTERVPEVVPLGMSTSPYPDRIVARPGHEAELAKRTLTQLYNQRPTWLAQAHAALDAAVAAAYGWPEDPAALADDEVLRRLLALNRERAAAETGPEGVSAVPGPNDAG